VKFFLNIKRLIKIFIKLFFSHYYYIMEGFDMREVLYRAGKYIVEGLAVALAAYYIPRNRKLGFEEVAMIAVTAAATFAILDMYSPSIGSAARAGTGFGVGANLAGFPAATNLYV
jgi:ABC-type Co2+ transport system permease subunit